MACHTKHAQVIFHGLGAYALLEIRDVTWKVLHEKEEQEIGMVTIHVCVFFHV